MLTHSFIIFLTYFASSSLSSLHYIPWSFFCTTPWGEGLKLHICSSSSQIKAFSVDSRRTFFSGSCCPSFLPLSQRYRFSGVCHILFFIFFQFKPERIWMYFYSHIQSFQETPHFASDHGSSQFTCFNKCNLKWCLIKSPREWLTTFYTLCALSLSCRIRLQLCDTAVEEAALAEQLKIFQAQTERITPCQFLSVRNLTTVTRAYKIRHHQLGTAGEM